jgi:hypothetical protein
MDILLPERRNQAEVELTSRTGSDAAARTVESLWTGLCTLRDLLLARFHNDVEEDFGVDSLVAPATPGEALRELRIAGEEIDVYCAVLAADEARRSGYATGEPDWFLHWLIHLRWGSELRSNTQRRVESYHELGDSERRRMFASLVERALPEATKTPLIIYRLFPRAVRMATALAFGDQRRAAEIRKEQISLLPGIADCHKCRGRVLDNGETCSDCGNPLWKLKWMNETE